MGFVDAFGWSEGDAELNNACAMRVPDEFPNSTGRPANDPAAGQFATAHEFGHMIGLSHTNGVGNADYNYFEPGTNRHSQNIMGVGNDIDARNAGPRVDAANGRYPGGRWRAQ